MTKEGLKKIYNQKKHPENNAKTTFHNAKVIAKGK
jgi:hypothetical protein